MPGARRAARLTAEDRFVSTENASGLDSFRFDQRNWADFDILFAAALLLGLGFLHFRLVGSRYDRPWVKFVFITIDIVLLSVAIASTREVAVHDLPPGIIFRFDLFPFYFVALAVAAFT